MPLGLLQRALVLQAASDRSGALHAPNDASGLSYAPSPTGQYSNRQPWQNYRGPDNHLAMVLPWNIPMSCTVLIVSLQCTA